MFQTSRTTNRLLSSCVGVVLACAGTAFAQDSSTQQTTTSVDIPPPGVSTFELPRSQDWEVGFFGGASFWQQKQSDPLKTELMPSAMAGGWFTENFSNLVSTEQTFSFAENNLRFHQNFGGVIQAFTISQHVYQFQDSLLVHFAGRRSAIRPYVRVGFGVIGFSPTQDAKNQLRLPADAPLNAAMLQTDPKLAFTYGAGFKVRIAEHVGLRSEVYGVYSREPHYGLAPEGIPPQLYIPAKGYLNGLQVDSGLYFTWGHKDTYTLQVMRAWDSVTIAASGNNVCAGPLTVKATVAGRKSFAVPNYRWTIDGHDAGSNSDTVTVPTDAAGQHQVALTVVDSESLEKTVVPPVTLTVNAHTPPTITANADKTDLQLGDKAMLYPHPQAGACPGTLSVAWTVTDGAVSGTDPATYDSSTVQFGAEGGTKQITATATVTDSAGGSASAPVTLTVSINKTTQAVRQDDIIFPTGNSRVNNCGKRVLIDQVYPGLTSGQYANFDVVLVGHMGNEAGMPPAARGRRGRRVAAMNANLAMERALHTAEILASGQGICPKPGIDISRIKIATVGAGQGADLRKPICAASIRERKASRIAAADDQLKDQRVEIWFVPRGANMPPSATGAQQAPERVHSECPK